MFGKIIVHHGTQLIEAQIIASEIPEAMPLISDGIDNLGSGYTLAPGSTMIVTSSGKRYILGTDAEWSELDSGSGGEMPIEGKTSSSPVTDSTVGLVQGLTIYGRSEVTESDNLFNPVGLINAGWNKNADGSYSGNVRDLHTAYVSGYKPSIAFKPQTQYTLSFDCHGASTSQSLIAGFYSRDSGGTAHWNQVVVSASSYTHYTLTSPADQTVEYIAFSFENNQTAYIKNFIVSEGSQEHEYEPYPYVKSIGDSGSITVTLSSSDDKSSSTEFTTALPLRGVSDTVRDKLTCTADKKQVETVCGEVDLGIFDWNITGDGRMFSSPQNTIKKPLTDTEIAHILCANYIADSSNNLLNHVTNKTIAIGGDNRIYVYDTDYTDATAFKTAMSGVMLIYELAKPVTTPLTTAEISAFRGLRTYDNTTNITISDEPEFEIDYLRNTENGRTIAKIQADLQGQIDALREG